MTTTKTMIKVFVPTCHWDFEARKDLKKRFSQFINRFDFGVSYGFETANSRGRVYGFEFEKEFFPTDKDKVENRIKRMVARIVKIYN